jgi:hypothetical protein
MVLGLDHMTLQSFSAQAKRMLESWYTTARLRESELNEADTATRTRVHSYWRNVQSTY